MYKSLSIVVPFHKKTEIYVGKDLKNILKTYIKKIKPSNIICITGSKIIKKANEYLAIEKKNVFILKTGESQKSITNLQSILNFFYENNIDKHSLVIGFGGGVISDIVGLACSIYYRGIPSIYVPTTLLAQVDAAIGGKNAINFNNKKNLIGTIYFPRAIFIDSECIKTLPPREIASGMGEVVKYAVGFDKSLLTLLNMESIDMNKIIEKSVRIKASIIRRDFDESKDIRTLLNLGHTLGQALESDNQFSMSHGEAVSIGLLFSVFISTTMGNLKISELIEIIKLLHKYKLPPRVTLDPELIFNKMKYDKKKIGNDVKFVLLKKIGLSYVKKIDLSSLRDYLYKFILFYEKQIV